MVDEMGADLNGFKANVAYDIDILHFFLARGADPAKQNWGRYTPIGCHVCNGNVESAMYLLQDSRVRATINVQSSDGEIALHHVSCHLGDEGAAFIASHLLQASANPNLKDREGRTPLAKNLKDREGRTPLAKVQEEHNHQATIALLEQAPDAEKTSLLVKARRLLVATTNTAVVSSYLEGRMARDEPSPEVVVAPLRAGQNDEDEEEGRKYHTLLLGMEGEGERMPRDVFWLVMDMLMPAWDPLRRGVVGLKLPLQD